MQAAQPRDPLGSGTEHQMIGVAKDDVGAGSADLCWPHRLDRGSGANRHESRRADLAAAHLDRADAGLAVGGGDCEGKTGLSHVARSKHRVEKREPLFSSKARQGVIGRPAHANGSASLAHSVKGNDGIHVEPFQPAIIADEAEAVR